MADLREAQAAPLSFNYAVQLLQRGSISKQEHDELVSSISQDIKSAWHLVAAKHSLTIPGNTTLSQTIECKRLEAASRVFNTPELLEAVLVLSDLEDLLLRINLTCKGFRDLIETSLPIQRKLFRSPDSPTSADYYPIGITGMDLLYPDLGPVVDIFNTHISESYVGQDFILLLAPPFLENVRDASCSLHKTHITQPPTKHLVMLDWCRRPLKIDTSSTQKTEWHNEHGFTFGRVADIFTQESTDEMIRDFGKGAYSSYSSGVQLVCRAEIRS